LRIASDGRGYFLKRLFSLPKTQRASTLRHWPFVGSKRTIYADLSREACFHLIDDAFKRGHVVNRDVGEDFAVDLDTSLLMPLANWL
jgi:hypothetical protein